MGWRVGDRLVVAPTERRGSDGAPSEEFTIRSISGKRVQLSGTLKDRHLGEAGYHGPVIVCCLLAFRVVMSAKM